mmetsp:Transcript_25642/g.37597  ORF Transcript_25642/g.37597 Transcript_25642/m.37597 type:complete len:1272 (+) Transcript_25642:157-3972(+)
MPPSKKLPQSDFKRIKAKVGKRAPKPANVTDTSFQSASVQVRAQTISHEKSKEEQQEEKILDKHLTSSRGVPLDKLLHMLRHPSPIVRTSGCKGIKDAITLPSAAEAVEVHHKKQVITMHLSILVPNISKCIVDEDDDVRNACLSSLRTLFTSLGKDKQVLQPFLPLLLAYISSALNSLDQDTKMDGTEAAQLVAGFFDTDMAAFVSDLLPPYIALLPLSVQISAGSKKKKEERKKKRKRTNEENNTSAGTTLEIFGKDASEGTRGGLILQSFVSLLHTLHSSSSPSDLESCTIQSTSSSSLPLLNPPNLQFVQGGVASNALLLYKNQPIHSFQHLKQLSHLPSMFQNNQKQNQDTAVSSSSPTLELQLDTQLALLTKLRDLYVECTQSKSNHSSSQGLFVHASNLKNLYLVLQGIRLFWNLYCHSSFLHLMTTTIKSDKEEQEKVIMMKLMKMGWNVHSLLLESFPILNEHTVGMKGEKNKDSSNEESENGRYETINGLYCSILSEMGNVLSFTKTLPGGGRKQKGMESSNGSEGNWVEKVFAHVLPRLDVMTKQQETNGAAATTSGGVSVTLMKVMDQLLSKRTFTQNQQQHLKNEYLLEKKTDRTKLLIKFGQAFFGLSSTTSSSSSSSVVNDEDDKNSTNTTTATTQKKEKGKEKLNNAFKMTLPPSPLICKSPAGKCAAVLLCKLIAQECNSSSSTSNNKSDGATNENEKESNKKEDNKYISSILIQMMYALPTYLKCWGSSGGSTMNLSESTLILGSLISAVRRVKVERNDKDETKKDDDNDDEIYQMLMQSLRTSIGVLFTSEKKKKIKQKKKNKRKRVEHGDDTNPQKMMENDNISSSSPMLSIFEKLPPHTQKLAISLLGMLQYPTEEVVTSLARICARCAIFSSSCDSSSTATAETVVVSNEMADYIMQVMYDMRKSMHMRVYLSFLIECVGIGGLDDNDDDCNDESADVNNNENKEEKDGASINDNGEEVKNTQPQKRQKLDNNDTSSSSTSYSASTSSTSSTVDVMRAFRRDLAIIRTCNYISLCCRVGSAKKMLSMLEPVLTSWLEDNDNNGNRTTRHLSRLRAALSILSSIAKDGQSISSSPLSFCVLEIAPSMKQVLINNIQIILLDDIRTITSGADADATAKDKAAQNDKFIRFLSPLVALLSCQTKIVRVFLDQVHDLICNNVSDNDNDESITDDKTKRQVKARGDNNCRRDILKVLLLLLKHPHLTAVWRDKKISTRLVDVAKSIESTVANGPLDRTGGELRTEVSMLLIGSQ